MGNWFKSSVKLTEQDVKIQEVVIALLEDETTLIEVDPEDMSYLLSNKRTEYYVDIDSNGIKITNHTFYREIHLESVKLDLLKNIVKKETTKRRSEKRAIIFKNGLNLLDNIVNVLNKNKKWKEE